MCFPAAYSWPIISSAWPARYVKEQRTVVALAVVGGTGLAGVGGNVLARYRRHRFRHQQRAQGELLRVRFEDALFALLAEELTAELVELMFDRREFEFDGIEPDVPVNHSLNTTDPMTPSPLAMACWQNTICIDSRLLASFMDYFHSSCDWVT